VKSAIGTKNSTIIWFIGL